MKIDVLNSYTFTTVPDVKDFIMKVKKYEQSKYPSFTFPQIMLLFGNSYDEELFLSLLDSEISRPYLILWNENVKKAVTGKAKQIITTPDNVEAVTDLISHWFSKPHPADAGWDGTIILRNPPTVAVALTISSYARYRNLFLIITVIDKKYDIEARIFPGNRCL